MLLPAIAGGIVLLLISVIIWQRKERIKKAYLFSRTISKPDPDGGGTYFGIPVFSYTELKVATNNFDSSKELGDGGFGTVYHGKKPLLTGIRSPFSSRPLFHCHFIKYNITYITPLPTELKYVMMKFWRESNQGFMLSFPYYRDFYTIIKMKTPCYVYCRIMLYAFVLYMFFVLAYKH